MTVDGRPVRIEVAETPGGAGSPFEAGDNAEYLRISLQVETPHHLGVTHESLLDRIRKKLRIDWEFQTGEREFDRRYWLHPRAERDRELLCDARFQASLAPLEPFTLLQVRPQFVRAAREMTGAATLEPEAVKGMIDALLRVADTIRSREG